MFLFHQPVLWPADDIIAGRSLYLATYCAPDVPSGDSLILFVIVLCTILPPRFTLGASRFEVIQSDISLNS